MEYTVHTKIENQNPLVEFNYVMHDYVNKPVVNPVLHFMKRNSRFFNYHQGRNWAAGSSKGKVSLT